MKMVGKKDIRPQILGINTVIDKSIEEDFQNNTLRQIIKLQHDLIVAYFKEYLQSKKIRFDEISNLAQLEFIATVFKKDIQFKAELKGIVIGHFTTDEFVVYCNNKIDYNKRILTMIEQRIVSVIELF